MRRVVLIPVLVALAGAGAGVGFLRMKHLQSQDEHALRELDQRLNPLREKWRAQQELNLQPLVP